MSEGNLVITIESIAPSEGTDISVNSGILCTGIFNNKTTEPTQAKAQGLAVLNTYSASNLNPDSRFIYNAGTYSPWMGEQRIAYAEYTPVSAYSIIFVTFNTTYDMSGWAVDRFESNIRISSTPFDGDVIAENYQNFVDNGGGDVRSGTLFPISCAYKTGNTNTVYFIFSVNLAGTDDNITFPYPNEAGGGRSAYSVMITEMAPNE